MDDSEFEEAYGRLVTEISEISYGWVDNWHDAPRWLNRSLRFLLQIINDQRVEFVAGKPADDLIPGEIHIFTPDLLISATIQTRPDSTYEECTTSVSLRSRADLVRVLTMDTGDIRHDVLHGRLQPGQTITLRFSDDTELVLPVAESSPVYKRRLLAFLPSLLADLGKS